MAVLAGKNGKRRNPTPKPSPNRHARRDRRRTCEPAQTSAGPSSQGPVRFEQLPAPARNVRPGSVIGAAACDPPGLERNSQVGELGLTLFNLLLAAANLA